MEVCVVLQHVVEEDSCFIILCLGYIECYS